MTDKVIEKKLIGDVCWRFWDGLLPAIFFELGKKKDKRTGEYSICFDTCPWQIFNNDNEIANSKNSEKGIDEVLPIFIGQTLTNFEFNHNDFIITATFDKLKIVAYLNEEKDTCYILSPDNKKAIYSKQ